MEFDLVVRVPFGRYTVIGDHITDRKAVAEALRDQPHLVIKVRRPEAPAAAPAAPVAAPAAPSAEDAGLALGAPRPAASVAAQPVAARS